MPKNGEEKKIDEDEKTAGEEKKDEDIAMDLTPEQVEELEDRIYKKMKNKFDSNVENAISKAGFVLKMTIPEAY